MRRRISERLDQWVVDSSELYDMAEINEKQANEDIFAVVYFLMMRGLVAFDVNSDEFASCVKQTLAALQRRQRE
jgi:hypothetical protein